jgi:ABC-2 type transport system ATP-binding protein
MEDAIHVRGLTKYYGKVCAVDHIQFTVAKGEVFGLLGPNGAGKTTIIRMLVGLTPPSAGTATLNGYDIRNDSVQVKRCVGVVPETSNLYDELTVGENLHFMAGMYHVPRKEREARIRDLLQAFGLTERGGSRFGRLSKGLKRRATIAAAVIHQPDILFLDEPTSGLDVMSARSLRRFLKELRAKGVTIFLTTHYIEEADQVCDRIAIMVKGQIIAVDTPDHLKATAQGRTVMEVAFTSPVNSLNLKDLETYGPIEVRDNTVRFQAHEVAMSLKAVMRWADDHGLEVASVNTGRPRLEDAFVHLTGMESEVMLREKERRGGGA